MILLFYKKYEAQFQKDLNWEIKLWPLIFLACCPLENKWSSSIQNSHFHLLLSSKQHPFDLKFRPWIEFDFHIYHTRRFFYLDDASVSRDEWDWMYCSCVWILNLGAILSVGGKLHIGELGQKLQAFLRNEIRMARIQSIKLSEGEAQHKYAFALMAYWWAKTETTC